MGRISEKVIPPYDENYEIAYNELSYKGKVILEVGADYGSTAWFFKSKGAKTVISVECDKGKFEQLVQNAKREDMSGVIPVDMSITDPIQLEQLIQTWNPDFVHMDCEGCEFKLIPINDEIFRKVMEYQLEIHFDQNLFNLLLTKLLDNGYMVKVIRYWATDNFSHKAWILWAKKVKPRGIPDLVHYAPTCKEEGLEERI